MEKIKEKVPETKYILSEKFIEAIIKMKETETDPNTVGAEYGILFNEFSFLMRFIANFLVVDTQKEEFKKNISQIIDLMKEEILSDYQMDIIKLIQKTKKVI